MNSEQITREILWSMPHWSMYLTWFLLLVSLVVFFIGIKKRVDFITNGKGFMALKELMPEKLQWRQFFQTLLLQGKLARKKFVGIFHAGIFFGFLVLLVVTTVVGIDLDTPLSIFHGATYKILSFAADFAGIFILFGMFMAIYRRFISKPKYLEAPDNKSEISMYLIISSFIIIGFLLEAIRIHSTGMPSFEAAYSPVGYLLAKIIGGINPSTEAWKPLYQVAWYLHMASTMFFIAIVPFTKFFHIVIAPFAALVTEPRTGGILHLMDFEDEEAETFGLGKVSELSMRNRLNIEACVECGRCTDVCPALASGKILDPKKIITKTRDFAHLGNDKDFWEESIFQNNELDACTTCGACMEECPMQIQHVNIIQEAKRYKVLTLGEIPAAAGDAVNKIKNQGNPWGISQEDRFKWADGLDVPVIEAGKKVDYLYFVGCAGSYDPSNQKVARDTIKLLKKAGVSFAVMGKEEKCCGDPIRRFGDEYSYFEVAPENIANMNKYQFDKVLVHCPHCLHTIGKEYQQFDDGKFDVVHHTELLSDLLKSGKLKAEKPVDVQLTFHDPCYLGRHHGAYNPPREILAAIPGLQVNEMERNKDKAVCCGMGGGNMWYELPEGEHIAKNRLEQIGETKMPNLATACSFCLINFESTKVQVDSTQDIEIKDVSSYLAQSVLD